MLLVIFVVNDGEKQEAEKPARQEDTVLKPHFLLSFAPFRVFFPNSDKCAFKRENGRRKGKEKQLMTIE